MAADDNTQTPASMMSFLPMAILYGIASLIAISSGGGLRRWLRMNLWIIGAVSAAFIIAYIEWSRPGPGPTLMAEWGHWIFQSLIAAGIIAAVLSFFSS